MVCRVKCTDIDVTEHNERKGENVSLVIVNISCQPGKL